MSPLPVPLSDTLARLRSLGINLWGVVEAEGFDRGEAAGDRVRERRPSCRSIVVIGAGGSEVWERVQGCRAVAPSRLPVESTSQQILADELARLRAAGLPGSLELPWERRPLRFMRLAETAGLGVISPVLFQLLHPVFGPWVSLLGAFLLDTAIPATRGCTEEFQPCSTCARPCVTACPAGVFSHAAVDYRSCAEHRLGGGCDNGCDARRQCPVGRDFRHVEQEERLRHQYSLGMMKRYYGMGLWKLVPFALRRGLR